MSKESEEEFTLVLYVLFYCVLNSILELIFTLALFTLFSSLLSLLIFCLDYILLFTFWRFKKQQKWANNTKLHF